MRAAAVAEFAAKSVAVVNPHFAGANRHTDHAASLEHTHGDTNHTDPDTNHTDLKHAHGGTNHADRHADHTDHADHADHAASLKHS